MNLARWPAWVKWETAVKAIGQPEEQIESMVLRGVFHVRRAEDGGLEVNRDSIEKWLGIEPELLSFAGREVVG